jgi:hypothetical protein
VADEGDDSAGTDDRREPRPRRRLKRSLARSLARSKLSASAGPRPAHSLAARAFVHPPTVRLYLPRALTLARAWRTELYALSNKDGTTSSLPVHVSRAFLAVDRTTRDPTDPRCLVREPLIDLPCCSTTTLYTRATYLYGLPGSKVDRLSVATVNLAITADRPFLITPFQCFYSLARLSKYRLLSRLSYRLACPDCTFINSYLFLWSRHSIVLCIFFSRISSIL